VTSQNPMEPIQVAVGKAWKGLGRIIWR